MRLNDASILMDQEVNAIGSVDILQETPEINPKLPYLAVNKSSNRHLFMIDDERK